MEENRQTVTARERGREGEKDGMVNCINGWIGRIDLSCKQYLIAIVLFFFSFVLLGFIHLFIVCATSCVMILNGSI